MNQNLLDRRRCRSAAPGLAAGVAASVLLALAVPERGSLAVLGRNGVGKTTLLATIMGHTTFHAGEISAMGRDIRLPTTGYRRERTSGR